MSAAKFTPGPWRYWPTVNGGRVAGHPADGTKNFVCDVLLPERSVDWEANARLIASAPDLLGVCRMVLMLERMGGMLPGCKELIDTIVADARAVIAKATGKTS